MAKKPPYNSPKIKLPEAKGTCPVDYCGPAESGKYCESEYCSKSYGKMKRKAAGKVLADDCPEKYCAEHYCEKPYVYCHLSYSK